jgi:hypothetical protein
MTEGVLLALCGYLMAGLVLLAGSGKLRDRQATVRRVGVVLTWSVAGVASALTAITLAIVAGLRGPASYTGVVVSGVVFAVIWFPIGGRIASAVATDARTRARLLQQLARERALALESARLVDADRKRLVQQTEDVVSVQLQKATALSSDPDAAAAALQLVVDEVVRPLSRELARGEVQEQVLVEAVHTMGAVSPRPLTEFVRELSRPTTDLIGSMLMRIVVSLLIVMVLTRWQGLATWSWVLLLIIAAYSVVISAFFLLAEARANASERELQLAVDSAEWASSRLRQLAWSERDRLGHVIHGDAQARIVATALQIQLGDHGDVADRVAGLESQIHDLLLKRDVDDDWHAVWDRVLRVWEYSVQVTESLDEQAVAQLAGDPIAAHAVVSVMREGVTNAVRHGRARCLALELASETDGVIRLSIRDDGNTPAAVGAPGMGSRTMDAACLEWNLWTTEPGHVLVAHIPTQGVVTGG